MGEIIKQEAIEGKLVESLEVKRLGELAADCAELGLDSILDDGIVKDIPILRTAVSIAKIGFNIRDRIYIKKIASFLSQIGNTTQEQREAFIEKYCGDTKRFEEAVLLILEQTDSMEKSCLIGKIFKACILGKITYENAFRLSEMVNKALWGDLNLMFNRTDSKKEQQRLFTAGLYNISERSPGSQAISFDDIGKIRYEQNDYAFALTMIHQERFDELNICYLGLEAENSNKRASDRQN